MLEDVLERDEVIVKELPFSEEIDGEKYNELAVTNKRLIWYKRKGWCDEPDTFSSILGKRIFRIRIKFFIVFHSPLSSKIHR